MMTTQCYYSIMFGSATASPHYCYVDDCLRRARRVSRLPLQDQLRIVCDPVLVHIFGRQEFVEQSLVPLRPVDRDFLHDGRTPQLVMIVELRVFYPAHVDNVMYTHRAGDISPDNVLVRVCAYYSIVYMSAGPWTVSCS